MLFRLDRNADFDDSRGCLGYQWIEVLAIEVRALGPPKPEDERGHQGWCYQEVHNWYICRTESGMTRFAANDIWNGMEEGEYRLA